MRLRLYKPSLGVPVRRPLYVTVRPDRRFTFNAEASRALDAADLRRVRLFGDQGTKRVVIRAAKADDPNSILITYVRPTQIQVRACFEAASFLRWLGYQPTTTQRFIVTPLPRRSFCFTLAPTADSDIKDLTT